MHTDSVTHTRPGNLGLLTQETWGNRCQDKKLDRQLLCPFTTGRIDINSLSSWKVVKKKNVAGAKNVAHAIMARAWMTHTKMTQIYKSALLSLAICFSSNPLSPMKISRVLSCHKSHNDLSLNSSVLYQWNIMRKYTSWNWKVRWLYTTVPRIFLMLFKVSFKKTCIVWINVGITKCVRTNVIYMKNYTCVLILSMSCPCKTLIFPNIRFAFFEYGDGHIPRLEAHLISTKSTCPRARHMSHVSLSGGRL